MQRSFSVSIHDVAPDTWDACEALLRLTDACAARASLLVVPRYHGGRALDEVPRFVAALGARVARGDEIVLHGFSHRDDGPPATGVLEWLRRRVYTASEGEFDALDAAEAARRLEAGRACLARAGFTAAGFIAPAWLMGPGCRAALRQSAFGYTSTRNALIEIRSWRSVRAPSLVFSTRSTARRRVSHWVNRARLACARRALLIRAALHPTDAAHADVLRAWRDLLDALARDRRPVLEREALAEFGRAREC